MLESHHRLLQVLQCLVRRCRQAKRKLLEEKRALKHEVDAEGAELATALEARLTAVEAAAYEANKQLNKRGLLKAEEGAESPYLLKVDRSAHGTARGILCGVNLNVRAAL